MIVSSLEAEGYRNLSATRFLPSPFVNVIYGDNAQGKTNLLEAVWLFTGGRSFRGAKDGELISFGKDTARLCLGFQAAGRPQKAELIMENGRRRASVNEIPQRSPAGLIGRFCAVIFAPVHLSLVKDGPSERRKFLDAALCQIKPAFATALSRYNKGVQQRNALLKDLSRKPYLRDTLDSWDETVSALGEVLTRERLLYLERLCPQAEEIYRGIAAQKETMSIAYRSSCGKGESLLDALRRVREEDIRAGITTVGPHRDDFDILVDRAPARSFASQGQQRSAVLALKLSEAAVLEQIIGEKPVVLLDDVMSELDVHRQDYLLNHMKGWQVFITCCDPTAVLRMTGGCAFCVKNGVLTAEPDRKA